MRTFFSAEQEHLNRLSSDRCAELFGEMLTAEARSLGMSATSVTIATDSTPDGGIDARVECESPGSGNLIVGRCPSYQIKAGQDFKPWQPSAINEELFGTDDHIAENLKSEVKYCLENGHTYILVCMRTDLIPRNHRKAVENLKSAVRKCGMSDPDVRVWGQEQVLSCLNRLLPLTLRVNGRDRTKAFSFSGWSAEDDMQKPILLESKQEELIDNIRREMRTNSQPVHINVCGETGVGKTRLVLKAMDEPDLRPLVVYCRSPRLFKEHLLDEIRQIMAEPNPMDIILVIDDCNEDSIWENIRSMSSSIKLVTINNEKRRIPYTSQLEVTRLSHSKIKEIILSYYNDDVVADNLAIPCDGIPRFAHIVGYDASMNPEEILSGDNMARIFSRYIRHGDEPDSEETRQKERMLRTFSLFKRFGRGSYFNDENAAVLHLVQKIDQNISQALFDETIETLKKRKVLQGEETLYLTPRALHAWLWTQWWEKHGRSIRVEEILENMPQSLVDSFLDMFKYASHSPIARSTLRKFFSKFGPLSDSNALRTRNGSRLFHALSKADPNSAVRYLEKVMGQWTETDLQRFTEGRRDVIYGLERIMFEPDLFVRGGRLLRRLAEAENETWSNNATGVFCDMFSLGAGHMSTTRAPPETRLPLLTETLCSQHAKKRALGLEACKTALTIKMVSISSSAHDEFATDVIGWTSGSMQQWQEAYRNVIDILYKKIKKFPEEEQHKGVKIILDSLQPLLFEFPDMKEYLCNKISDLRHIADDEEILDTILSVIEFDRERIEPSAIAILERIRDEIEGHSYSSLMKRYVGMGVRVDLLSKEYEHSKEAKIKQLAKESLDRDKIRPELEWLVTTDAKSGGEFGYELSLLDVNESLLPEILKAQRETGEAGSGFFLSGYLTGIFQKDTNRWNEIMQEISEDSALLRFLIELSCRSGITDKIGTLLMDMVGSGRLLATELAKIVPAFPHKPSSSIALQWIEAMLNDNRQESVFAAMRMFHSMIIRRKVTEYDTDLLLRLLTHNTLFEKHNLLSYPMVLYYWKEAAMELIEQHRDKSLPLISTILENMDSDLSNHPQMLEVLNRIAAEFPDEVWDLASRYAVRPLDTRGHHVSNWMRGGITGSGGGFLNSISRARLIDWIDGEPDFRAPYMAIYVPPKLNKDSLAMELLARYGSDERVFKNLLSNFLTGFFMGSAVNHYKEIKENVEEYQKTEDSVNINRWLDSYLEILNTRIEKERIAEERMFT